MIKVGVIGAAGRMGATVCAAIAAADGLQLVAAVETALAKFSLHDGKQQIQQRRRKFLSLTNHFHPTQMVSFPPLH